MDQKTYQDILDVAIQNEIEANLFYHQVAEKVKNDYLRTMFLRFAEEELKHRTILEGFRDNESMAVSFARVQDFQVSETIEEPPLSIDMKPADAIALAMKKEEAAMQQYTRLANVSTDADQIRMFLELAEMERDHKTKLETAFVDIGYPEVW
jgi:rubrerythrin